MIVHYIQNIKFLLIKKRKEDLFYLTMLSSDDIVSRRRSHLPSDQREYYI